MLSRRTALGLIAALFGGPALAAPTRAPAPEAFLRQLQADIDRAAPAGRTGNAVQVERIIARAFDLDSIARTTLGTAAATATPLQVRRLARNFALRVTRETLNRRKAASGDATVTGSKAAGPGEWLVYTRSPRANQDPVTLSWRVKQTPAGLRIMDVLRDGTSIVAAQKRDIQTALRTRSLDAVILALEQKYAQPGG